MCGVFIVLFLVAQLLIETISVSLEEGDFCTFSSGENGTCVHLEKCPFAINLLQEKPKKYPQVCGFRGRDSLVCCKETVQKERIMQQYGEISSKKCKEYYPYAIFGILIPGGKPSLAREFPHMAAIGFGDGNNIQWLCGGSLISKNFVLTAAHCLFSRELGLAKWVRLGELDLSSTEDQAQPQDFTVKRRIAHPDYKIPPRYNDIGLIELDRDVNRTFYVGIACLDATGQHNETQMVATGWGKTEFAGDSSNILLKTNLDLAESKECQSHYANLQTYLPKGVISDKQLCAGGKEEQDTCQGDSGGPLQIRNEAAGSAQFSYIIVGITSFGKPCGLTKSPAIYTRVYGYLPWIENIVWPS